MGYVTTEDGTEIYYKGWGSRDAQPVMFHHGWPLSADDWDTLIIFFLNNGYRVIAHGHSTQSATGNDMDTYCKDADVVVTALDLSNVIHIGHSTGSGEVCRYVAQYSRGRANKAVLISAVPPLMLKTETNPGGLPMEVFDGFRAGAAQDRAQLCQDVPAGPFFGLNRPGATVSQGLINNWWRQGKMGGTLAH